MQSSHGVKLTFFSYRYLIDTPMAFERIIRIPDLLTLTAMKAYALGGTVKWKIMWIYIFC